MVLIFLFLHFDTYSQSLTSYEDFKRFATEYITTVNKGVGTSLWKESEITGSAYLSDEFTIGNIITNTDITYSGIPLRYNIYNDNMEFKLSDDSALAISNPGMMKEIQIGEEVFIYCYDQNHKGGYYSRKVDGEIEVLSKYVIIFNEPEPPIPFREAKPPSFSKRPNELFLKVGDHFPVRIANKKDLEAALGEQSAKALSLIKKEKLNIKKEADLIKLAQLIEGIN